jgi:hypothetical protein
MDLPVPRKHITWAALPLYGILVFIILYVVSTFYYPGGSFEDRNHKGFDWSHNYWCELMAARAKNGETNTARPIAITAMFVLAFSLGVFWFHIPRISDFRPYVKQVVRYCGIFSMAVLIFFLAGLHDTVINVAGVLGVIAMGIVIAALFRIRAWFLFSLGIICVFLCIVNNYVYYSENFFYYLPVIQKISFVAFLLWFWLLNFKLLKKVKTSKVHF